MGYIIELVGLPGSGKSTIAKRLKRQLPRGRVVQGDTPGRWPLWFRLNFCFREPLVAVASYLMVLSVRGACWENVKRVGVFQAALFAAKRKARVARGAVVIDEGPVHCLAMALFGTESTWSSRCLLRLTIRLSFGEWVGLCVVNSQKQECLRRWQQRCAQDSRFDAEAPVQLREQFIRDNNYREVLRWFTEWSGKPVMIARDAREVLTAWENGEIERFVVGTASG